jgi:hypothetical protein
MGDHVGELCYAAYQHGDHVCGGCPVALSYRDGGIHTVERTAATANGTHFAEVTASSVRDADNRVVAGIELVRNITDRKRTEEALKASEKKYRALVDTALVGIYRTTMSGQFLLLMKRLHACSSTIPGPADRSGHCGRPLREPGAAGSPACCASADGHGSELRA